MEVRSSNLPLGTRPDWINIKEVIIVYMVIYICISESVWFQNALMNSKKWILTVGGDKFIVLPRRSWGPILECRRIGNPPPGVPPGLEAHEGAIRIFGGIIKALSESRRFGNALCTRRKLLSGLEGEAPNHQPPDEVSTSKRNDGSRGTNNGTSVRRWALCKMLNNFYFSLKGWLNLMGT